MAKIDEKGDLIRVTADGLVKLDGVTCFRKVERDGKIFLQFHDQDRMRSQLRKTPYVEIEASLLLAKIQEGETDAQVHHHPME